MQKSYDKYFENYHSKIRHYYNTEINTTMLELFPAIMSESGDKFECDMRCPLSDYIISTWNTHSIRKNIVLLGDGGAGKTINLLASYRALSEQGIYCAFIPLSNLDGTDAATIEKYFREYIIRREDEFYDFLDWIETSGESYGKPLFVLFLDGYNEVHITKNSLYIDLCKWLAYKGIQVVISNRGSLEDIEYLKNLTIEFATLMPLDFQKMISFVKRNYPEINTKKMSTDILKNPMMLTLFISNQKYAERYKNTSLINLRQEVTVGSTIWNYMQFQLLKYNELLRETEKFGYEQCNLWIIINCILPYIGWKMEHIQRITISYDIFDNLVYSAYNNIDMYKQELIKFCYKNNIYNWNFDEVEIKKIIFNVLGFFKKDNGLMQFRHQIYRDFFAAFYLYKKIFAANEDIIKNEKFWITRLISFDTMKLFCDLLSGIQIQMIERYCMDKKDQENSYAIDNLFQMYNIIYEGNLNCITLKRLDLKRIYLNQYKWVEKDSTAVFWGCSLANASFYGDGHHGRVINARYSPDEQYIASSCTAGEIKIWQSGTAEKVYEKKENASIYALCWYNNCEVIYGTMQGECFIYNIKRNEQNKLFQIHSTGIRALCCCNANIYVGCSNGELWQKQADQLKRILNIQEAIIKILCNENKIILLDNKGHVWLYFLNNTSFCQMSDNKDIITDICYSKDYLIACTVEGSILYWFGEKLIPDNRIVPTKKKNKNLFKFTSVMSNNDRLFFGTQNGEVIILDIEKNENMFFPIKHSGWVRTISFAEKRQEIVSGGSDGKVIFWDMNSLSSKIEKCGNPNMILCHEYIYDSNLIISSSNDSKVIIWDVDSALKVKELTEHIDWVRCIATGNTKDIFSSGGSDGRINVWYIDDRKTMNISHTFLYQGNSWIMSLDWSYDDNLLISAMQNGEIRLWKKEDKTYNGELLYSHHSAVHCVRFSTSGRYIASSDHEGYIYLYNFQNVVKINISNLPVRQIRWSKDERYLYACCLDGYIVKYQFQNMSLNEVSRVNSHGARSIEIIDGTLMFAGINQELWSTNFFQDSTFIDKEHSDSIDYIAHNKDYYSTSGHDGNLIVRDKRVAGKIVKLKLIPGINISGCKFMSCFFEDGELYNELRMNGGIIENDLSL